MAQEVHGNGSEKPAEPTMANNTAEEDVPDPDEGDLDDLDDMLDEFSNTKKTELEQAAPEIKSKQAGEAEEPTDREAAAEEFSKQLQEQMAALMGSMDETPEMKREIEEMMKELGAAADPGASSDTKSASQNETTDSHTVPGTEEPFQETIRKTMKRMQESGEQATAAAKSDDSDDILMQMMKEMQNGGLEGDGGEEGFNKMLMGMMEQLTNKEILCEPMKELHDKYPAWIERNQATTSADDLKRYQEQQRLVHEIVGKFEDKNYSDNNAMDRGYIVDRMQKMQAAGNPPADLVGDMNAAQDALGDVDSGCTPQ